MQADWLIKNIHLATFDPTVAAPYGAIRDALVAVAAERILWAGPAAQAPSLDGAVVINGKGGWLTPGLIDCHTHLVYGGDRAEEFEWRLQGRSYADIAAQGGGILSTVAATRAASATQLLDSAARRLRALCAEGVTTVEIKSGYGLALDTERRMLVVARALGQQLPITVRTTFLGAHALPPQYQGDADGYIDTLVETVLPALAAEGLVDAVDVFCEGIGFSVAQCRRLFERARELGLPVKGHVEQLSYQGGARLVAEFGGLSVDHVEYLPETDLESLAQSGAVAVLLPGAFYYLQEQQKPPIAALRRWGIPMAVATDLNPGSSPMASLLLALNQACILFGLTPEEALLGATRHAAAALGLADRKGCISAGFDADMLLWDCGRPAEICYGINMQRPRHIWVGGRDV
ncbi:imidazolonepropionase [Exilibacterium tricleocarpae]|uniref:Imidazolonepropionase n=1 Tax=Exilibacterium tricleocarpae TaxID=2591008 RepID=A0A545TNT4_9GAMM|nr:imidazolonepropionase [Exilibacterium tricleocarpae]TQV78884.1 imidazolonepropionase [Exilibacterium tricleocarpae]